MCAIFVGYETMISTLRPLHSVRLAVIHWLQATFHMSFVLKARVSITSIRYVFTRFTSSHVIPSRLIAGQLNHTCE
jgi:hypothetical protein